MNLIARVFFMSMCVFTAYALPRMSNMAAEQENVMLRAVISQLQNAMVNPQALANNSSCPSDYSKRMNDISIATVNQTEYCYNEATNAFKEFDRQMLNYTVGEVNGYSKELQNRLANCSAQKSNEAVLECYVNSFDKNLGNLYNLTIQAQIGYGAIPEYEWQVGTATKFCVERVLIASRVNQTSASHDLQVCMNNSMPKFNHSSPSNKTNLYYVN